MTIFFSDALGNPLPPGTQVIITTGGNFAASGYFADNSTNALGTFTFTPTATATYSAYFAGVQAPSVTTTFTGSVSSVIVADYISPTLTLANYVQQLISTYPKNWLSDAAKESDGNFYNLMNGISAMLSEMDGQNQTDLSLMRLQTLAGSDIDSWANDFFGVSLQRLTGETDTQYILRIIANLQADKSTLAGITRILGSFGTNVYICEPWEAQITGGLNSTTLSCNSASGGVGGQAPFIQIFIVPNNVIPNSSLYSTVQAIRGAGIDFQLVVVSGNEGTIIV